jgi:choline transport protein
MAIFQSNEKNEVVESKDDSRISSSPENGSATDAPEIIGGDTHQDLADMMRLGKKQEFKVRDIRLYGMIHDSNVAQRNFGLLSTLGFVSIYMATWEYVLVFVFDPVSQVPPIH